MEQEIRFCTSADGTRIAYAAVGEGRPLFVVPGWGHNLELDWKHPGGHAFVQRLSQGRMLVSLDRRGVGGSQRQVSNLSLESHVADVDAVATHLGLEEFDLFGSLDGAAVSAAYAAQHPERVSRMVLWNPFIWGGGLKRPALRSLLELIRKNWGFARRGMATILFPSGPADLERWWADLLLESISPDTAARYMEFAASLDARPYLLQVKAPTLVLHRSGYRDVPVRVGRQVAARIPDTRFVPVEGDIGSPFCGDLSHLDHVCSFLDEGRAQAPAAEVPTAGAFRTILFTDIEGSTALTQRLGDDKARELLREHERIVRKALAAHGGSEVKTMGDGFMASFGSATKALECAVAIQQAFAERNAGVGAHGHAPLRIRIGLNAGEPIAEEDPDGRGDLFGTAVNLAARIAAQAQGGEVLASDVVQQLVAGKGFLFADRGEVALRGFKDPVRLYEVRWREE